MGIANHIWGVSSGADQIWAQVAGLSPQFANDRLLLMLQAYIDESYNDETRGAFVLAGCIATAESWAAFSRKWEPLVRKFGTLTKDNSAYHFHMKEMAENAGRMENVPVFFRAMEDHVLGFVSASLNMRDLQMAISRIQVSRHVTINWQQIANPYRLTFSMLMDRFHIARGRGELKSAVLAGDSKIDFFFDDRREKKRILDSWDTYMQSIPDSMRKYYGSTPSFKNDHEFLPLQAADFWAWWVRKWTDDGVFEKRMEDCDFGTFKKNHDRQFFRVGMAATEDILTTVLKELIMRQLQKSYRTQVWDIRLV